LRGTLEDLLTSAEHDDVTDCFVSATLTDRVRPVDAMRRLRERFPYAVHLDWEPEGRKEPVLRYAEAVRGRSDVDIARGFLDDCRGAPPSEREDAWLVAALEAAGKHDPGQAGEPASGCRDWRSRRSDRTRRSRSSTSTRSVPTGSSCSTAIRERARRHCSTPSRSRSSARFPGRARR